MTEYLEQRYYVLRVGLSEKNLLVIITMTHMTPFHAKKMKEFPVLFSVAYFLHIISEKIKTGFYNKWVNNNF